MDMISRIALKIARQYLADEQITLTDGMKGSLDKIVASYKSVLSRSPVAFYVIELTYQDIKNSIQPQFQEKFKSFNHKFIFVDQNDIAGWDEQNEIFVDQDYDEILFIDANNRIITNESDIKQWNEAIPQVTIGSFTSDNNNYSIIAITDSDIELKNNIYAQFLQVFQNVVGGKQLIDSFLEDKEKLHSQLQQKEQKLSNKKLTQEEKEKLIDKIIYSISAGERAVNRQDFQRYFSVFQTNEEKKKIIETIIAYANNHSVEELLLKVQDCNNQTQANAITFVAFLSIFRPNELTRELSLIGLR